MRRKEARELFMKLLFQMEVQDDYSEKMKDKFVEAYMKNSDQANFFDELFHVTVNRLSNIDKKIEECSDKWSISRIGKVDLAVLRLSTAEILYMEDIPVAASINEAVDIAKEFGGEDSGKFVNGILGNIARSQIPQR
ncbi:MAG: transcription antitermination factor NusB [Anaerovorax sp.]